MSAWMIRAGRGGAFASQWLQDSVVGIFFDMDCAAIEKLNRDEIKAIYARKNEGLSTQELAAAVGQIFRFSHEMSVGATVVMYEPSTRLYHIGEVLGSCVFIPTAEDKDAFYSREVNWTKTVPRDALKASSKNALGAISTLFSISPETMADLNLAAEDPTRQLSEEDEDNNVAEVRYATAEDGIERIKDKILGLAWDDMELLVAGLLRAMGYKTMMTKKGSDGGRDIIASPDGLGLERPRIIVEVKHRKGPMGAPQIRAFIGGLRSSDSGLFVSTGGFSREAQYEADRSTMPIRLLDLDQFVRLLVDNYDSADTETRALLPLVRIYWPA